MIQPPPPPPNHNDMGNSDPGKQSVASANSSAGAVQNAFELENGATAFIAALVVLGFLSSDEHEARLLHELKFSNSAQVIAQVAWNTACFASSKCCCACATKTDCSWCRQFLTFSGARMYLSPGFAPSASTNQG